MRIHVTARGLPLTPQLEDHVHRRVRFALGRFASRISLVRIRIVDLNGPRGGVDTRCSVQVHLPPGASVIVDDLSASARSAVDLAVDRTGRAVSRHVDRMLTRRRKRSRAA